MSKIIDELQIIAQKSQDDIDLMLLSHTPEDSLALIYARGILDGIRKSIDVVLKQI